MNDEFDFVVIGGGSAGSVMAGRLTEDPEISVCLLEAGGSGDSWMVKMPVGAVAMVPTRINNWAFETVPQPGLNGRRGYQPRGKALGGSSALNAMVYIRGHRSDYDHWAQLGNSGWSFDDVLPYFKKSEHNEQFSNAWHGQDGPLWVSDLRSDNPIQQHYLEAARQAGYPLSPDFNAEQQEGLGVYQVTQKNGERWSAARAYLMPHLGPRSNLRVETGAYAERLIIEQGRAVGVEVRQGGMLRILRARREVILAAGAFQSPQLLMLSGIGDGTELRKLGIQVRHHLPGVGKNLQDHPDFVFCHKSDSLDTFGISASGSLRMLKELKRFRHERRGMLTSNFAECGGFLKTRPDLPAPNLQLHFVVAGVEDHARKLHLGHGFSCHVCLLRPQSKGEVSLRNTNPQDAPLIDPKFLDHPQDLEDMVDAFKMTRKLLEAPALAAYSTRDIRTADAQSDEQIRAILRQHVDTVYHPVGTCKMGVDQAAVVDPTLRVRGIQGLRVVDASIMPTLIGGNTNAPTIMIAEKAVDLIRQGQ
ncbi:GMC oxidoreductase family protein [Collimonas fungivorans]|uniref:GMC oxidoreductase family protein n=1 Tax=Collimonas fungivorans TaxID=158899 RepID=A0A127PG76_9BURK|nr:choline dehydrogenase [Collimonas fungivorans]AMO96788.1 GMC oxidoreductase family protein [Collimonas fungivorans]